jgi:hypothetical protein
MSTKTLVRASTVDALIGGFRAHLLGRPLPTPAAVTLHPYTGEVSVVPGGGLDVPVLLGNILLWAYTLVEVTAEWVHTESGRLHVSVWGRTSSGLLVHVYGGCRFAECLGLVQLGRGESEGVSLDELYTLAGLLREAQHQRGVA